MDDPLVIRISTTGPTPLATVNGAELPSPEPAAATDGVALYLQGASYGTTPGTWRAWLESALAPWLWLDTDQGWAGLATFRNGSVAWSHDFGTQRLDGWTDRAGAWAVGPFGTATTPGLDLLSRDDVAVGDGELIAVAERGHNGVGVEIGNVADGQLLLVRPLHRDLMWWRVKDGVWVGPTAGGTFNRPWQSALKDLVRHLLRPYFLALGLATAFALIGVLADLAGWKHPLPRRKDGRASELPSSAARDRGVPAAFAWPIAAGLAVAVLGATGYIAYFLLDHMPHVQDSVAYLFQAKVFALGRLWVPTPPLPDFFVHEFVVMKDGRWFAKYPPGWPAVLSLGVLVGAPWLVSPLCAALGVLATFRLGGVVHGRGTGLLAAFLLALSPFFLFLAGDFMSHTSGLLFGVLFAIGYAAADRGGRRGAVLAGLALGVDLLIRPWTAACIAAPFGVDLLVRARRSPRKALTTASLILVGVAPFVVAYFAYNWYFTGSPAVTTMELWWPFDRLGFGPDKGLQGHTPANGLFNTLRNVSELAVDAFGWPSIATFALALVPFAIGRARRWERLWLSAWLCLMVGYFFWWADGVMYGPRFYHEAMPFIALLSARGVVGLAELGRTPGRVLAYVLLGSLLAFDVGLYIPSQLPGLKGYNYVSAASLDAVAHAGVHDAVVFTDPGPAAEWWNYGMVFSANSPLLDTDVIYARDLGAEDERLMALYPGRRFYRLRKTSLVEIHRGDSP